MRKVQMVLGGAGFSVMVERFTQGPFLAWELKVCASVEETWYWELENWLTFTCW